MVKRYDPFRDMLGLMENDKTGDYVEFNDYKKVRGISLMLASLVAELSENDENEDYRVIVESVRRRIKNG